MGNKCIGQSGEKFYKSVKNEQFHNETDLKKKYKLLSKVYSKRKGLITVEVKDILFDKIRILKQVFFKFLV
jgi:hypothetical protein